MAILLKSERHPKMWWGRIWSLLWKLLAGPGGKKGKDQLMARCSTVSLS